MIRVGVDME